MSQHLEVPFQRRTPARVRVPPTSVRARPLRHLEVPALRRDRARNPVPRAAVRARPLNQSVVLYVCVFSPSSLVNKNPLQAKYSTPTISPCFQHIYRKTEIAKTRIRRTRRITIRRTFRFSFVSRWTWNLNTPWTPRRSTALMPLLVPVTFPRMQRTLLST